MATAIKPNVAVEEGLPEFEALGQREFLTGYGQSLADMMGALMQPIYTSPEDASVALASQVHLERKPLGAQGFAVEALATGRSGRKPRDGKGGVRPLRGQFLVGEMATGKTFMSLLYLYLADQRAHGQQQPPPWQAYRHEAFPAVVLLPVTLLEKFAREALETIPGIKPVIVLPIRQGKKSGKAGDEPETEASAEEREAEASIDVEASLRGFDPTYDGRNLSAVGVMERVARRIRYELGVWEEECQRLLGAWRAERRQQQAAWKAERRALLALWQNDAAQATELRLPVPACPALPRRPAALPRPTLPLKPRHLVILSQSVAKLGSAWKPSYTLRPLVMRVNGKARLVRDEEHNPQFVPCCPRCGKPLVRGTSKGPNGEEQVVYLTEQDLLGSEPGDRKKRFCTNVMRRWNPETQRYRQVPCRELLWQAIPALTPPKLTPLVGRSADERSRALPLPGKVSRFERIQPAPSRQAWEASADNPTLRQQLERAYQAEAWQWRPAAHNPSPPRVVEAPERRYPLAHYIQKRMPGLFKTALIDEVHQYSGAGTAQGYAAQALVDACDNALGMTGTLFGGYPRNVYHLLWRLTPEFRQDFGPRDVVRFVKLFGKQQRTYKERFDAEGQPVGAVSKRRQEPEPKDLPGINPMVLRYFLENMVTVELRDVWLKPTRYTEQVVMVEMGPVIGPAYEELQRTSTRALRQLLARGDRRAVSAWFHGLLRYPNMPWEGMQIVHPSKQVVLGTAPKLPENYITPKERQMLRDVRRERAERRRDGGLGRRILIGCQSTNKHDLQPRLKRLLEEDDARWRKGLPVLGSDGDPQDNACPPRPPQLPPIKVRILRSGSPGASKRERWLRQAVHEGIDVLICHSKLVEVGLDLRAPRCAITA